MRRRLRFLALMLLLIAGGVYYHHTAHRRSGDLVLTGIVTTSEVIVSSQIQGRIRQLLVKEGDTVKREQLLAVIDPQALEADNAFYRHHQQASLSQVAEAEAALRYQQLQAADQVRQAEAQLAATQAQQSEASAELENARLNFQRTSRLYEQEEVSRQAYDQARTSYEAAQARVESLAHQVQAARAAVALARANREQVAVRQSQLEANRHQVAAVAAQKQKAQVELGYTRIRAPIDGLVDTRVALPGEVVNPGQAIVTLINLDDLWVRADVEETYVDRIRLGDRLPVRFPSGLEREGTVFFRGVDADFATQRDVSRSKRDIKTFEVRLRVDNSDRRLHPGLTAYVTVPL